MKIEDAYLQFVNLVNRNLTNNNISVDKPRFVMLFNDITNRYIEWQLEKRNEDDVRYISKLLVLDKTLTSKTDHLNKSSFTLPKDYFDLANLSVFASNNNCKNKRLFTYEVKSEDIEEIYQDPYNTPSFEFRETFYTVANNAISVYKKDFSLDKANLSYYRYPKQVDIQGYIKSDGTNSISVDPELDDKAVGRILVLMVKEFSAINNDPSKYQLDKDRGMSEV